MSEQEYLTVHQFAKRVDRFPNYIYKLLKHGNSERKLKSKFLNKLTMIPVEEVWEFPFTSGDKLRASYQFKIIELEERVKLLEEQIQTPKEVDK